MHPHKIRVRWRRIGNNQYKKVSKRLKLKYKWMLKVNLLKDRW